MHKALHGLGFHLHVTAKKTFINEKQRVRRLPFAKQHKD
jgi:hypothetical protein